MKVLLATEGSEYSKAAIEKCCQMFADSDNTEVRIISAVNPTITSATQPFGVPVDYVRELDAVERKRAKDAVSQAAAKIRESFPALSGDVSTAVATGSPAQVIVEEAETWGADVIFVGSHGYGFLARSLLGSVSNAVVHHAPCSVMVVRTPEKPNGKNT